ncbi:MAG: ABC transporter substrate-binding protein [Atribacterota bacterium]|nr:ABC transporter substrate-binding protein [Atribacterota bacterium]
MKNSLKVTILLLSVTLMLVLSCLASFAEEKVIRFARPEDIEFLDPYGPTKALSTMVWYMIYDRLIILDPDAEGGFAPELATEWEISPDAKEYTFKLREGVKFHNGEPFNAETVKGSMERFIKEPTLGSAPQWINLEEVEIVDDYKVIMKFKEPNVVCLNNLAYTPMIPVKAFAEKGTALFDNPIGTGAFMWDHWKRGQELVVKKNPDYWGKPAYVDKFVFLPLIEPSTRLAAILTGEIDISDLMNIDDIPTVESLSNVEVQKKLGWIQIVIALKTDTAPMTDIKFRQAIDLAIDREGIVNNILKGGRVSTGYMMENVFGFDESAVPVKRDVEKAIQLVKESIYDGRVLSVMIPLGWYPFEKVIGEAVQAQFKHSCNA